MMTGNWYVQMTVTKDVCVHCGDWAPIVEVRDAIKHTVLEVGCQMCIERKGYR